MKFRVFAAAFSVIVPAIAFGQANKPASSVTVTNDASNPVPVAVQGTTNVSITGTPSVNINNAPTITGITNPVTVRNTAATPLYVTPTSSPSASVTTLLYSTTITFNSVGTRVFPASPLDVSACSTIRTGVGTSFSGDTVAVTLGNELGFTLDKYIVGTVLGGNITDITRVYETPGLSVQFGLTLQNLPTGNPITLAIWCR